MDRWRRGGRLDDRTHDLHRHEWAELRARVWRPIARLLVIMSLVAAGLSFPVGLAAVSGAGAVGSIVESFLPSEPVGDPRLPELSQTTSIYDRHGTLLADLDAGITRISLSAGEMPPTMVAALLAAEDRRFFEHGAIDPPSLLSAAVDGAPTGSVRGASTITQQVVKRAFLSAEQTVERKLIEAWPATALEQE